MTRTPRWTHVDKPARSRRIRLTTARVVVGALVLGAWVWAMPARAQTQYHWQNEQWQAQKQYDPHTPEGEIQTIRQALAKDDPGRAISLADKWIKNHPNHPALVQAYFLRGDAYSAERDYYTALYDYEAVLRRYPGSDEFNLALEREYEIARLFSHGVRRKLLGLRILTAYGEAAEVLIRLQERAPGSDIGEKASIELGEHYMRQGQMNNAATSFDLFLQNYPRSQRREYAMLRLIQCDLAIFKGPRFDATGLLDAGEHLRTYQKEFPVAAEKMGAQGLLLRIDESLARKEYETAHWYIQRGEKVSAAYELQRVVRDHPQTPAAQDALHQLTLLFPGGQTPPLDRTLGDGGPGPASAPTTASTSEPAAPAPADAPKGGGS